MTKTILLVCLFFKTRCRVHTTDISDIEKHNTVSLGFLVTARRSIF